MSKNKYASWVKWHQVRHAIWFALILPTILGFTSMHVTRGMLSAEIAPIPALAWGLIAVAINVVFLLLLAHTKNGAFDQWMSLLSIAFGLIFLTTINLIPPEKISYTAWSFFGITPFVLVGLWVGVSFATKHSQSIDRS